LAPVLRVALALGVVVFFVHAALPTSLAGGDTLWSVPTSYSVVHHGNVYLDDFPDLLHRTRSHTGTYHGHSYMQFPFGPSIVTAPVLALYDGWLHLRGSSLLSYINGHFPPDDLEIKLASLYVALSTVFVCLLLWRRTRNRALAVGVAGLFAFATSMVSTVSRALWTHAPAVLFAVIGLYLLQVFVDNGRLWAAAASGAALGVGYFVRPTMLVPLGVFLIAITLRQRRAGLAFAAGAAVPVLATLAVFVTQIHRPLSTYYSLRRGVPMASQFFPGLAGNLVSPSRGLFVWSPFLLVAVPAAWRAIRRPKQDLVATVCVVVIVLHWISSSTLRPWWAGWSVGPRLFSDVLPFMMVLVADGLLIIHAHLQGRGRQVVYGLVAVCVAWSLFTNLRAATHQSVQAWNYTPTNVDHHGDRNWDWSDPQFLR
jgi:hypothetical protein